MNQKIKATATLVALCSVPIETEEGAIEGKFGTKWSVFFNKLNFIKRNAIVNVKGVCYKYDYRECFPKTAIIIKDITLKDRGSFTMSQVTIDITNIEELRHITEILFEAKPTIEFDIETIMKLDLTIDYKYSNFRKPQK
jgi:hypothetical protein